MTGSGDGCDPKLMRRLMRALDQATAKLEDSAEAKSEPIAVIGIGCRFPGGADSPDEFWRLLADGFDGISEVPPERWDVGRFFDADPDAAGKIYTRRGGFLGQIDQMDARFFEIAPREAASMDPQQRLFLEVCWEALEHAGLPADQLCRSRTGVYVGVTANEYANLLARSAGLEQIDAWFGTGNALNSMAGRVAHTLGLQGPAMAVDTACSSSLVAVHLACQSLAGRECGTALAGGVNLVLSPEVMIAVCRAKMLAADGRCKTFDAAADGYARGEGCGVVVLRRLADALEDGDNVLAVLRGSAVNQDGPSSGLTVPNPQAQRSLIRQALAAARLAPSEIDYLEAHGTGTPLGDPIEVQAAAAVLAQGRPADRPLILGSVKTNIGHLESAAGIAGLIKVVLALGQGEIPPHLHCKTPNPHIPWQRLPVAVATRPTKWPVTEHPRRAGLSSFGACGTNAHVIVEQAPEAVRTPAPSGSERPLHPLSLSAKTPQALRQMAGNYARMLESTAFAWADICFSANTGRSHFDHRLYLTAATTEEASIELEKFADGDPSSKVMHGRAESEPPEASGLTRQDDEKWDAWLRRLGELYVRGADLDWHRFDGDFAPSRRVPLPTYPWQWKRHWFQPKDPSLRPGVAASLDETATVRALLQGDVAQLMGRLERGKKFSDQEKKLLAKLLQAVAGLHREDQVAAETGKWLYRVEWRRQARAGRPMRPDFLPRPDEIRRRLHACAEQWTSGDDFQRYWPAVAAVEQLGARYVLEALVRMGMERQEVGRAPGTQLAQRLQVDPRHHRLFEHLLGTLSDGAVAAGSGPGPSNGSRQSDGDPGLSFRSLLSRYPMARAELTLLDRCGRQLDQVLRGRVDPLQLLFPDSDGVSAAHLYQDSPGARLMNRLVGRSVATIVGALPAGRRLRILEIGAGTAGTTTSLLPHLPADRCEYLFTDLSPRFTAAAREKLQEYPFIDYRVLDIEQRPESQGFEAGTFDVVIAANVLHATRDVGQSVRNARRLLAPEGMLVLLEATKPMLLLDLIFGMTEGWWRFADHQLRPCHPLLEAQAWERLLLENGFQEAAALTAADDEGTVLSKQSVVLAKASQEKQSTSARRPPQHWIILADQQGVGRRLASLATSGGDTVTEVYAARRFQQTAPGRFSAIPERVDELLPDLAWNVPSDGQLRIVHLWNLDVAESDLDEAATLGCRSALKLVQWLIEARLKPPARLCFVTRGAASVEPEDAVDGLAQAPLWGMARVIASEHPEWRPRRVDLCPGDGGRSARFLYEELQSEDAEDEVALRSGFRYVPRLVRSHTVSARTHGPPVKATSADPAAGDGFAADATYLISGGLGGLGLLTAHSMVRQGARHLVLIGRSEPSAEQASQLEEIRRLGGRVLFCPADVSRREDVVRVLTRIDGELPPLRGVIHAAGVLDDGTLGKLSWDRFNRVLSPKVRGAWHLHRLTAGLPLDFFLLFSSATSLLGPPGQANHAAANAFLDALACHRRARDLPALSINWGAWSKVGAAAGRQVSRRVKLKGIEAISPQQGLAVLKRIQGMPLAQVAVIPIDWSQQTDLPPLFAELAPPEKELTAQGKEDGAGLRDRLMSASAHRRCRLAIDHVRSLVAAVLGLDAAEISPGDGFMALGMDSLSSIELRNRLQRDLQCPLPSTVAFDFPTARRLADFMLSQLARSEESGGRDPSTQTALPGCPPVPEDLSEDGLGALIDTELMAVTK